MNKEATLQTKIVAFLSAHALENDFYFFSVPNEGALTAAAGQKIFGVMTNLKKMGLTPGVFDLLIVKGGQVYHLEVKDKDKTLSAKQIIFNRRAQACGGITAMVDDYIQAVKLLNEWGIV